MTMSSFVASHVYLFQFPKYLNETIFFLLRVWLFMSSFYSSHNLHATALEEYNLMSASSSLRVSIIRSKFSRQSVKYSNVILQLFNEFLILIILKRSLIPPNEGFTYEYLIKHSTTCILKSILNVDSKRN